MYHPNIRGSRVKRRSRRLARRDLGWLIALGAAVPVLVTGYYLAAPGARSAAPVAAPGIDPAGLGAGGGGGGAGDGGGRRHHHHVLGF